MKKFLFLFLIQSYSALAEYQSINIPCKVKECNPELGDTNTRLFLADPSKPVLMIFGGGTGQSLSLDHMRLTPLEGKLNMIIVRSSLIIQTYKGGKKPAAYNKFNVYRARQAIEFYKKKFNKPIWLMGVSNGGPRMIGALSGSKKENHSKNLAGLVFSSPANGYESNGQRVFVLPVQKIKYQLNLPILIVQHARDRFHPTSVSQQKTLLKKLKKKNKSITELKLLTSGDPGTTNYDGGHHWFYTSEKEHAETIFNFIMKN